MSERTTQHATFIIERRYSASPERVFAAWVPAHLTDAQKADPTQYAPGDLIQFHQNAKGHTKGSRVVLGEDCASPTEFADRFEVYRPASLTLAVGDRVHNLTTLEMQLLRYFIEHAGQVLPRHQILESVWDESAEVTSRTIDNFVLRLRKIIEPDPSRPKHILSVRGTGYRFMME